MRNRYGPDRSDEIRWRVAQAERDELRAIGDRMQSEASRLAEWAISPEPTDPMPYEVAMATIELRDALRDWTEARTTNWPDRVKPECASPVLPAKSKEME